MATEGGRLKLATTNLEIALTCWVGAQVEEEGAITVPARLLTDFVSSLPSDRIDMTVAPRARQLKLECARNKATIGGMDAEDFPPIPSIDGAGAIELDPQSLHKAITQVVFAAATDDSRPVLTGIHMLLEQDQLTLAAADGFRLAVHRLTLPQPVPQRTEIIVPARAVTELNRLLSDEEGPVQVILNAGRTQVLFRLKGVEMVAQLIQGTFPNYQQLIPQSWSCRAIMDRAELLRETRIAAIFARDGSGVVRLQIFPGGELTQGKLSVSARAEEVGDHMGELDAVVEGESAKIAFNSRYLLDVLQVMSYERVVLEVTSPSSPGILKPSDSDEYIHVVMPMFVQW